MRVRRGWLLWAIATAIAVATLLGWLGYARTLDPRDLGWIFHEDPFTHVMGWEQFRNEPLLQYPLTKNELYGLEWSSSLVFADSVPIAALALRPLSAVLPHPFQYLGWWTLLSLVLQGYFGARLVQLRSERLRDAALGAVVFATAPVLLERFGLQTALGSHWLLLWALWLYFSGSVAAKSWAAVLGLAVAVHAYLFVMVGGIWVAHLIDARRRGIATRRDLLVAGGTLIAVLGWMHALGYFVVGQGVAGGGWRSSFDLATLVVATGSPDGAYLGAGVIALAVATLAMWRARRRSLEREALPVGAGWTPLAVVLAGFAAFAITDRLTLAGVQVGSVPVPHAIDRLYETFRGAARMIWPVYYALVTVTLWAAIRVWPARVAGWVLGAAIVVQLVDVHAVASRKAAELGSRVMTRPLADPIWPAIAQHYRRFVSVPSKYWQADWPTIAWFAARNGLGCNVAYLSRTDQHRRLAAAHGYIDAIASGRYDPDTAYYFASAALWEVARTTSSERDLAVVADGMHLLLPGAAASATASLPPATAPALGTWVSFAAGSSDGLLLDGWWWPEAWGTWSALGESWLTLPVPPNERVLVTFRWVSGLPVGADTAMRVLIDGRPFEVRLPRAGIERERGFEVTTSKRLLDVRFELADPGGHDPNTRVVGVGLIAARVERAVDAHDDEVPDAARGLPVLDSWISFADGAPGRALLGAGWSWGEPWGTWTDDSEAVVALPVPIARRVQVSFRWLGSTAHGQALTARVSVDDRVSDVRFSNRGLDQEDSFEVVSQRGWVLVRLDIARPLVVADGRRLGVALKAARVRVIDEITPASPPTR